jgi:hypothetical protein
VLSPPSNAAATTADRRSLTSGYRLEHVRSAAAEAGISERYVERAAAELGLRTDNGPSPELAVVDVQSPPANPWAGGPTALLVEVQAPGEVPESELDLLVGIIRRRIGDAGHVGTLGRTVSWSTTGKERRLQISIIPRGGVTTIRIDERLGPLAGALFGGIVGGGGGGSAGIAFGVAAPIFHSIEMGFGLWGAAVAAIYALARTLFAVKSRGRERELTALAEELAEQVRVSSPLLPRPR